MDSLVRILGIDPGSICTGYGLVEQPAAGRRSAAGAAWRVTHLAHGTLRAPRGAALAFRLAALQHDLAELLERLQPDEAVVERAFVAASPRAALVLGHARGVALAALGVAGIPVFEIAPARIKLSVAGSGVAEKRQIQAMVQRLLGLSEAPPRDAADALAAALCHAQAGRLLAAGAADLARSQRRAPRDGRPDTFARPATAAAAARSTAAELQRVAPRNTRFVLRRR